ncbi:MAG: hypothetical protein NTY35_05105 [Planctomycetota bacterium]|nr:hypothetical protein [Planctomycetota bacterium]
MNRLVASLFPVLLVAACSAPRAGVTAPPEAPTAVAAPAATKPAIFAPANATAWSYWPEEWNGPLLIVEVLPHGAKVKQGDVLARFDLRPLDEQIRSADLELKSAQIRHTGLVERQRIDEEAAKSALAVARAALARTDRSLAAWKESELAFQRRGDEIDQRRERSYIEDQQDELGQLEEMYKRDELVNGTEDIVLKRQKRALLLAQDSTALSRDRAKKRFELDVVLDTEQREEARRTQAEAVDRQARMETIEGRSRADALQRSAEELADKEARVARLKRDRDALAAKAPRDGVFLHGASRDWRPGRTPARIERGSNLGAHTELALVADAGVKELRLELSGADLARWKDGARVTVRPQGGAQIPGKLRIDPWPRGDGNFDAWVELDASADSIPAGTRADVEIAS